MGQECNDGALLVKNPTASRKAVLGRGSSLGLGQHFSSQLLQCPDGAAEPRAGPRELMHLCVCLPRLGRELARGELQPASSREFAHKS